MLTATSTPPPPSVSPSSAAAAKPPLISLKKPINRRHLLFAAVSLSAALPLHKQQPAEAALLQMPPFRLINRYYLVRAGESEFESLGIINTNPVAKTSVDNGLSEIGKMQTVKSARKLKSIGACDDGYIVPEEYSFLDARGLGGYEGKSLEAVSEVYASDAVSQRSKPPPIDDGTPQARASRTCLFV